MKQLHFKLWENPQRIDFYEMLVNSGNHSLIAGTTGSGKSVLLNNCIDYLLCTETPKTTQFIFFDPKIVELSKYKNMVHTIGYYTDIKSINGIMRGLITEMNKRYKEMDRNGATLYSGNKIIVVVDEVADLLTAYKDESKKFCHYLQILLAKARACKINFVLCTQAPRRDIISGKLLINIPTRCALRCSTQIESRQIINVTGAEKLPKYGSCLLLSPDLTEIKLYSFGMVNPETLNKHVEMWSKGGSMVL